MTTEEIKIESDNYFSLPLDMKTRYQEFIDARCFYYKFCRTYLYGESLNKVGSFVNVNHATVIHGLKKFDNIYTYDIKYREEYEKYENHLILHFKLSEDIPEKIEDIYKLTIQLKRLKTFYRNKYKRSQVELNTYKTKLNNVRRNCKCNEPSKKVA